MKVLESVRGIFNETNNDDFVVLDFESEEFKKLMAFRNTVVDSIISENEVLLIITLLKKKEKTEIYDFVISNLFLNVGFLRNEQVKDAFSDDVYDFIVEELEEYGLIGDKIKIIDLFYDKDYDKIETLLENLIPNDRKHIFKYILEHSSENKVLDKTTALGIFVDKHKEEIGNLYDDEDLFDLGDEIEFIP